MIYLDKIVNQKLKTLANPKNQIEKELLNELDEIYKKNGVTWK